MGGIEAICSPPPEPSPASGGGRSCGHKLAKYLPLSAREGENWLGGRRKQGCLHGVWCLAARVAATLSKWDAVGDRFRVTALATGPWDGTLRRREYSLLCISLLALFWLLPLVQAITLLGSAVAIYAIGESSWPYNRRFTAVLGLLCAVAYAKFADVEPRDGWVLQGIEAFFILRGVDFALYPHADARVVHVADRLARFLLWMFFLPTLCLGPMTSYGDFYRSYRPTVINRLPFLLPALAKIVWGGLKFKVLSRGVRVLRDGLLGAATSTAAIDDLPFLAGFDPRLLVWAAFCLDMIRFYLILSGFIDIMLGVSRVLGFHLPENFDNPLFSASVVRYWKTSNVSVYRWLMTHVFFRYWEHHRITAKVVTTFLVSGVWHLMLLRALHWEAVLQISSAFVIFGLAVAAEMTLSHTWKRTQAASTKLHRWAQWPLWGGKVALTFSFIALIHGLFLNGLAGKPLAATLEAYRLLFFGGQ
jgi:D-alanyl-lipoteichoic acid acyltransferase DltB (MBOAT superfamily)